MAKTSVRVLVYSGILSLGLSASFGFETAFAAGAPPVQVADDGGASTVTDGVKKTCDGAQKVADTLNSANKLAGSIGGLFGSKKPKTDSDDKVSTPCGSGDDSSKADADKGDKGDKGDKSGTDKGDKSDSGKSDKSGKDDKGSSKSGAGKTSSGKGGLGKSLTSGLHSGASSVTSKTKKPKKT